MADFQLDSGEIDVGRYPGRPVEGKKGGGDFLVKFRVRFESTPKVVAWVSCVDAERVDFFLSWGSVSRGGFKLNLTSKDQNKIFGMKITYFATTSKDIQMGALDKKESLMSKKFSPPFGETPSRAFFVAGISTQQGRKFSLNNLKVSKTDISLSSSGVSKIVYIAATKSSPVRVGTFTGNDGSSKSPLSKSIKMEGVKDVLCGMGGNYEWENNIRILLSSKITGKEFQIFCKTNSDTKVKKQTTSYLAILDRGSFPSPPILDSLKCLKLQGLYDFVSRSQDGEELKMIRNGFSPACVQTFPRNLGPIKDTMAISRFNLDLAYIVSLAGLWERSFSVLSRVANSLPSQNQIFGGKSNASITVDVLVIGAGVHEQIFQNTLTYYETCVGAQPTTLTIERGAFVAQTFRDAGTTVDCNSSSRAEGVAESDFIPGSGNINHFPLGAVQLPDVSTRKYPPLGVFAKVATINRSISRNDILFGWEVVEVTPKPNSKKSLVRISPTKNPAIRVEIEAGFVVDARGIGQVDLRNLTFNGNTPLSEIARKQTQTFISGKYAPKLCPKIFTSDDFYAIVSLFKYPLSLFENKKVAVVGAGDSAKTIIEFLLGIGGGSVAPLNGKNASEICWVVGNGVDDNLSSQEKAMEFLRRRYQGIAAYLPSKSGLCSPKIKPYKGRVKNVREDKGKIILDLQDKTIEADFAVFSTGLKNSFDIYDSLRGTPPSKILRNDPSVITRDTSLLVRYNSSPFADVQPKRFKNSDKVGKVYFIGPVAGEVTQEDQLERVYLAQSRGSKPQKRQEVVKKAFEISENFVSLFALGPLSEATAFKVAQDCEKVAKRVEFSDERVSLNFTNSEKNQGKNNFKIVMLEGELCLNVFVEFFQKTFEGEKMKRTIESLDIRGAETLKTAVLYLFQEKIGKINSDKVKKILFSFKKAGGNGNFDVTCVVDSIIEKREIEKTAFENLTKKLKKDIIFLLLLSRLCKKWGSIAQIGLIIDGGKIKQCFARPSPDFVETFG